MWVLLWFAGVFLVVNSWMSLVDLVNRLLPKTLLGDLLFVAAFVFLSVVHFLAAYEITRRLEGWDEKRNAKK